MSDDDGGVDNLAASEPFDPDLIIEMMEAAISAVVREQGLLNDAWDELEARELVMGMQMHRMGVMMSWLGLTPKDRRHGEFDNDNA